MKTFFSLNQECENALIDFPFHDNTSTWLEEQKILFQIIEDIIKGALYKNSHGNEKVFIDLFFETYTNNK
jgi:TRAP-type mannitol/chloroaromatic compound transport system permease small subunit